ncbi:MAG: rhodanese-like protein [Proteobacteria bacterium]|nr:rhodanese-like protein [Pseudomonadota bacterium]
MAQFGKSAHKVITAVDLKPMLDRGEALVVDVREPDEFADGHIPGAINLPLSAFSADRLPPHAGKLVVLNCLGGKRSGLALDQCNVARSVVDTHLVGGFGAWTQAGLPVER